MPGHRKPCPGFCNRRVIARPIGISTSCGATRRAGFASNSIFLRRKPCWRNGKSLIQSLFSAAHGFREPQAAQRALDFAAAALSANPTDEALRRHLKIVKSIAEKSRYYEMARRFGQIVGAAGERAIGGRIMIMTGGGPGIMEASNRGAHDVGAASIGLNITLPGEQYPNPYVTPELCFSFHYFATRKLHFLMRARALVAFPGGFGTLDELFEVLSLAQTRKIAPVPVILVGESYWRRAFDPEFLVDEGVIDPEDRDLFWFAESAEDAWRDILYWYEAIGQPLLPAQSAP